ncbi:MAG TPA: response regulator transcription factor [Cyclobacteriaceae bacterium]|nr:response regulator transcription factor [Cyclobacteriaceae bacterium]HMV08045.1 response regulator transcription factor [Cyclobacteriaceae bacterium]HMV88261.1 response regulator transcription factor [Cyclobacteriaceae bacterium]HMX00685.1 response regulator transcription factor [Cyclobacteriaceae bacterium]HMX49440.1 response regulator transcription factor [Cyclobacteriaceae bacterium]
MTKPKILLVEDDPSLGFVVKDNLLLKGYEVTLCKDGAEGEQEFNRKMFDLCVLDVMLPKKDGFSLARTIREKNSNIPIIFLTAKAMVEDKLEGFGTGADDYITKPFSLEELYCRIEVFLKRSNSTQKNTLGALPIGEYEFDTANFTLRHKNDERVLTSREAEILKQLYLHRDRVLKREEILLAVWGNDDYFLGRSLDVFISKIRKYLKDDPNVQITNFHGVGFKLEAPSS